MSDRAQESGGSRGGKRRRRFTVDSLFQDTSPRAAGVRDLVDAKEIAIDRIVPDPNQPRQTFDDERLEELAASIRNEGVLQPIAVRYESADDSYVILHGERRWRAARIAGIDSIPAIVREVPEDRRLIQQLMENVVREDLNAVERAAALRALKRQMDDAPWERVAESVGIKRSRLFQLLSTEKLAEPVQDAIRAGRLSEKQSRVLQGLPDHAQQALSHLIVGEGLSEPVARRLSRAVRDDPDLLALDEGQLGERLTSMSRSLDARPSRQSRGRHVVIRSLRALLDDRSVPEDPDAALDRLRAMSGERGSGHPWMHALAYSLARQALGNSPDDQDDLSPDRLRALRRLIDLALDSSTDQS